MDIIGRIHKQAESGLAMLATLSSTSVFYEAHALGDRLAFVVTQANGEITPLMSENFNALFALSPNENVCEHITCFLGLEDAFQQIATGQIAELQFKDVAEIQATHGHPLADYYLFPFGADPAAETEQVLLIVLLHAQEKTAEIERQTKLHETELRLQRLAQRVEEDSLTKILNRYGLMQRFEEELDRVRRYQHPLAVLLVDFDNFKLINDQQGHLAGDSVLQEVTALINANIRKSDIFGRYGGDEFILLQPMTTKTAAHANAVRLKEAVQDLDLGITLSIGVAEAPDAGLTIEALIGAADKAMYVAKRTKNSVAVYTFEDSA